MVFDSVPPVSSAHLSKDCNKKKRANRSAKLKQCKMDARREQWLSQVKTKGGRGDEEERFMSVVGERNGKGLPLEAKLEAKPRGDNEKGGGGGGDEEEGNHDGSDSESSPLNSPGSVGSSVLSGSNSCGTNFTGTSVSSCASSGGTCSGTVTEDEEEEEKETIMDETDGCVDDWEAIADALDVNDKKHASSTDLPNEKELSPCSESSCKGLENGNFSRGYLAKSQPQRVSKFNRDTRAWRADDAHRPNGLPNLSKQRSLPMKSGRHVAAGFRSFNKILHVGSACDCPICYEELDVTDASFCPCPCGFRMCLFCYKRICEEDGRCPGCRKYYKNKEPLESDMTLEGGGSSHDLA